MHDDLFALIGPDGRRADIGDNATNYAQTTGGGYPRYVIHEPLHYDQSVRHGMYRLWARGDGKALEIKFTESQAYGMFRFLKKRFEGTWDIEAEMLARMADGSENQ